MAAPVEVALGAVGAPGHPAGLHLGRPVEVVPVAADLLAPSDGLAVGRAEVVPLPGELLPAGERPTVPVEVALQAVRVPGDPAPLHDAGAVEVVPVVADLLAPLHRLPVGSVVVGLAADGPPRIARIYDVERDSSTPRVVLTRSSNGHRRLSDLSVLPIRHLVVRPRFQCAAIMRYRHIGANGRARMLVRGFDARHGNRA